MRIRTIKPEFFLHDRLFDSEKDSGLPMRLAFIGLWCASDREGRFKWEPRRLGASILPYDMVDFSRVLDALTTRGFIEKHASQGVEFGVIPSFLRHQVINNRESPSALPEPTEESIVIGPPTREPREADACGTREVQVKAEGKGRKEGEGKGKGIGKEGEEERKAVRPHFVPPATEELTAYAKEVGLSDPQRWMDHYVSNGWKVGKTKMVDWRACVRNWARSSNQSKPQAQKPEWVIKRIEELRAKLATAERQYRRDSNERGAESQTAKLSKIEMDRIQKEIDSL